MRFNAMLLGTIALIAMISRPGAAEETATVTLPPQQINPNGDTLEEALQNFAHRLEIDKRLEMLEGQMRSLIKTNSPVPPPPDAASPAALDQRARALEQQIQELLASREPPSEPPSVEPPKPERKPPPPITTKERRRHHDIEGIDETAGREIRHPIGCPPSVCPPAPSRTAMPIKEYDEAGNEVK